MAWRCSGSTNTELINNLFQNRLIKDERVRDAMLAVDRKHYCPDPSCAYEDSPQSIGHAATISAPHMHASAAESLLPYLGPGKRVLDIGSGSGYLTSVLAELVFPPDGEIITTSGRSSSRVEEVETEARGLVVGLEHITELKELGERNARKGLRGRKLMAEGRLQFAVGDGRKGYIPRCGSGSASSSSSTTGYDVERFGWDAIHVGAAAVEVHDTLIQQLRSPGRIFIPVEDPGNGQQWIWVVDKNEDGEVVKQRGMGVRYVPLTDAPRS